MTDVLWKPDQEFKESSGIYAFMQWLAREKALKFDSYDKLWSWSTGNYKDFWLYLTEYFDIRFHSGFTEVVSQADMPGVSWFEGATLNYAEHIFQQSSDQRPALVFVNETKCYKVSWQELSRKVQAFQKYLIDRGIRKGDRVAAYMPNIPETIIAFLAVNSIGAIWSCCAPDFGADTVLERFEQIEPRLLITVDGYQYNGKKYNRTEDIQSIYKALDSVHKLVLVDYMSFDTDRLDIDLWEDIMEDGDDRPPVFEAVDFNFPIWVLYSSGTTGKPKAITHSHGGMLLEHLKYMHFHNDVKPGENFFWYTTTGWMMWNFLQSSLLAGATAVLYDGSPAFQSLDVLWRLASELPIHHFGTSAPYLTACMKKKLPIAQRFDLKDLKSIGSTGAPLPPEAFEWIYQSISDNVWLCSMSGGTDVCTAFVGGNPLLPVTKGRIQCRALGCGLMSYDEAGNPVQDSLGEMVIETPMPSMPIYFWGDPEFKRYKSSYFEKYPGKWCHGDWIKLYEGGSLIIQGRSDATLNRKGIRIGTAEIYSVLNKMDEIDDSLIINLEKSDGEDTMPLFVTLKADIQLDEDLRRTIRKTLKEQCSPRHVPDEIIQVSGIPYTLSGKKMEVPVKKLFMGFEADKVLNRDAMRNPEVIDEFMALKAKVI